MKKLNKKGISLIVLIITIIVIIILATAVIQSFSNNNPIGKAKEATFKNDVKTIQEELEMAKLNTYFEENPKDITINDLKTAQNKYKDKFTVRNGKLKYIKEKLSTEEITWAKELGVNDANTYVLGSNKNDGVTISEGGTLKTNWNGKIPDGCGTDIIIPDGVTRIEGSSEAFYACTELTSVVMPESLTYVRCKFFWWMH